MAFWMSEHLQNITGGRPPSILYTEAKPPGIQLWTSGGCFSPKNGRAWAGFLPVRCCYSLKSRRGYAPAAVKAMLRTAFPRIFAPRERPRGRAEGAAWRGASSDAARRRSRLAGRGAQRAHHPTGARCAPSTWRGTGHPGRPGAGGKGWPTASRAACGPGTPLAGGRAGWHGQRARGRGAAPAHTIRAAVAAQRAPQLGHRPSPPGRGAGAAAERGRQPSGGLPFAAPGCRCGAAGAPGALADKSRSLSIRAAAALAIRAEVHQSAPRGAADLGRCPSPRFA